MSTNKNKNSKGRAGSSTGTQTRGDQRSQGRKLVADASRRGPSRIPAVAGVVVVVVLIVIIAGYLYQHSRTSPTASGPSSAQTASVAVTDNVVRVGAAGAPVTLDLYEDALCPICAQFEQTYGAQLGQALDNGKVAVNYHLLNFLNSRSSSGDYSTRAAAAALAVAQDGNGSAFPKFHSALFATGKQPVEQSGSDLSNADLAKLAADNGASAATQQAISAGTQVPAAAAAAQAAQDKLTAAGQQVATPTVLNGTTKVDTGDPKWLTNLT